MGMEQIRLEIFRHKARGVRQYQIARAAGMHPSTLSAIVNEIVPVQAGDPRLARIASALGLSVESIS